MSDDKPFTWPHRHERLREIIADQRFRKELFDIWAPNAPRHAEHTEDPRVLEWHIDLGRALLDWPDVDRDEVKRCLDVLLRAFRQRTSHVV